MRWWTGRIDLHEPWAARLERLGKAPGSVLGEDLEVEFVACTAADTDAGAES